MKQKYTSVPLFLLTVFLIGAGSEADLNAARQDLTDPNFFIESRYNISSDETELIPPKEKVSEETAVIPTQFIWTENNISTFKVDGVLKVPLCWLTMEDDHKDGREITKKAIQGTWERFLQVEFVGWDQKCEGDSWSIKIKVEDSGPHTLGLGSQLEVKTDYSMLLNFEFHSWGQGACNSVFDRRTCIHSIAVHEFGHALGMEHEHNSLFHRINSSGIQESVRAQMIRSCRNDSGGVVEGADITRKELSEAWRTKYDKDSVMNYCKNIYNHAASPSQTDINSLRKFYGARLVSSSGS